MGRGIFLFVGGPLASLIAPVPHGHMVFYSINLLQGLIVLILLYASWVVRRPSHLSICIHPLSSTTPFSIVCLTHLLLCCLLASSQRIFTVAQDFWNCVETSVSVFVVLELDDRVLPMLREDVKRKCRRSLLKRGLTISDEEAQRETQRAMGTSITAGKEYALHGLCMLYFITVLLFSACYTSLFAC
jgi:hypothetical protein